MIAWLNMKYRTILKIVAAIALLGLLVFLLFKLEAFFSQPRSSVNLDQSSVVLQIRSLNRLETSSFTIEKIIEAGNNGNAFQNILYGDRILLIAHGEVIAGVNLSKLKSNDVKVTGSWTGKDAALRVTLPAPEILVSKLDNEKTRVYDRRSGLFTPESKDLETEARAKAEQSIRQAACDAGILDIAAENTKKQVEAIFRGVGFAGVNVEMEMEECK